MNPTNLNPINTLEPAPVRGAPYRPALDIARFWSALWVMLAHAGLVRGAGHAVAIFFVLSGFLIGGQLVEEKRKTGHVRLDPFYFKRITRIWLPYFIVLAFYVVLFVARGQNGVPGFDERLWGALTYTYNIVNDIRANINPTWISFNQIWSLSIEEQFYLLVPLAIGLLPPVFVAPLGLLLGAVCLVVPHLSLYAGLCLGVCGAAVLAQRPAWTPELNIKGIVPWAGFLGAAALLFHVGNGDVVSQDSLAAYALAMVMVISANYISIPAWSHRRLRYLGLMTYSYYLTHGIPGYFLSAVYRRIAGDEGPVLLHVGYGLLAFPLSYGFVRWIEQPALRARNRMLGAKSPLIAHATWVAWGLSLAGLVQIALIVW